jgi:TetR/AcrR family transcriptional repressor of nem operon
MARIKTFDKTNVLDRAVELFWQKGCQGTSMQDLVDHLGISRSSLYDTYGDKGQLFLAALEQYRHQTGAALLAILEGATAAKPVLRQLFEVIIEESLVEQPKGCLMVNTAVEAPLLDSQVAQVVEENRLEMVAALGRLLERGQSSGEISTRHPARTLAGFVFNTITGIRVSARAKVDHQVLEDIVEVTMSALE